MTKHLPPSVATVQGQIHKQRQNLQITKLDMTEKQATISTSPRDNDMHPDSSTPNVREHRVAYKVVNKEELVTVYKDLTGRFPV